MLIHNGSHLPGVKRCKRNSSLSAVNDIDAKKYARFSRVLVVTELDVSWTQFDVMVQPDKWSRTQGIMLPSPHASCKNTYFPFLFDVKGTMNTVQRNITRNKIIPENNVNS